MSYPSNNHHVDNDDEFHPSIDDDVVDIPKFPIYNHFNDLGGFDIGYDLDELYYIMDDVQDH